MKLALIDVDWLQQLMDKSTVGYSALREVKQHTIPIPKTLTALGNLLDKQTPVDDCDCAVGGG